MSEQKSVYQVYHPDASISQQLNMILNSIADRLDRLEGLRGAPTFYQSTFNFPKDQTEGYLKLSSNEAQFQDVETGDLPDHNHTAADQGGDYPWADFLAADVTYLQTLVADIEETNLVDKSASEIISGEWNFTGGLIADYADIATLSGTTVKYSSGVISGLESYQLALQSGTVSGEIEFQSGSSLVLKSGSLLSGQTAKLTTLSGATIVYNSGVISGLSSTSAGITTISGTDIYYTDMVLRGDLSIVGSGSEQLIIESTNPDANPNPELVLFRNSASPAAYDYIGTIQFKGKDSAGNNHEYSTIRARIEDANNGSEDSWFEFYTSVAGTSARRLSIVKNNVGIGTATFGSNAAITLAVYEGTAPTSSPADTTQIWSANRGGTAGKNGLHIRSEDGTSHVFSDYVGINNTSPEYRVDIKAATNNEDLIRLSHPSSPTAAGAMFGFNTDGTTDNNIITWGVEYSSTDYDVINVQRSTRNVGLLTTNPLTTLDVNGGQSWNVTTVNAATYDLLVTDHILHVTYTVTGAVTSITLPTAQCTNGRVIIIKDAGGNAGTNNITIDTQGAETINGSATAVINVDYGSINLYSDGSNWFIF